MTIRVFLLAVLFGGLALVAAPAQPPTAPKSTSAPKVEAPADPMAEEIEIMRRLLDRTLEKQQHTLTGTVLMPNTAISPDSYWLKPASLGGTSNNGLWNLPGQTIYSPPTSYGSPYAPYQYQPNLNTPYTLNHWTGSVSAAHVAPELRAPQGVYLKGYGVVYTATLALPTVPPIADAKKPARKPLTDWERTRQELHGEKAEPAKTTPQDTLADAVLKVLAKNGQHFSQLADTEQITVALTLPRTQSCRQCHAQEKHNPPSTTSTSGSTGGGTSTGTSSTKAEEAALKSIAGKVNALKKDAEKAALLGDLHQKQGKNEQAAASFAEALKLYLDGSESLRRYGLDLKGTPEKDTALEQDLIVAGTKLVQAYMALGKTDEVKKTLKMLDAHVQKTAATETPSKTPEAPPKVELPAKLVISAPKKLLDLVGADKITFDEFRKNATVEYRPARTVEKQPDKP